MYVSLYCPLLLEGKWYKVKWAVLEILKKKQQTAILPPQTVPPIREIPTFFTATCTKTWPDQLSKQRTD